MKSLDMLKQVDHSRKAAIYAAGHDGKLRNFAYTEELGECRETFSRLLYAVQDGEIGVILTPDAASLGIETAPGWMEAFIQAIKQRAVLIGDHGHDLVYDLREEEDEARFRALFSPEGYERERLAPRPLAHAIAQSPFVAAYLEHGENWFLVTRLDGQDADTAIYVLSSGALGQYQLTKVALERRGRTAGGRPRGRRRDQLLPHGRQDHSASPPRPRLFFRASSL